MQGERKKSGAATKADRRRNHAETAAALDVTITSKGGRRTTRFVNSQTRVGVVCAKGHASLMFSANVLNGHWCRHCADEAKSGAGNPGWGASEGKWRDHLASCGLSAGEYRGCAVKTPHRCRCGSVWDAAPGTVTSKDVSVCPPCAKRRGWDKSSEKGRRTFESDLAFLGCVALTEYVRRGGKRDAPPPPLRLRCPEGHEWETCREGLRNLRKKKARHPESMAGCPECRRLAALRKSAP